MGEHGAEKPHRNGHQLETNAAAQCAVLLYAIMRMASLGHAPQEGWNFLEERRCVPGTVREAYEVLSRYHLEDVERLQVQQMRAGLKEEFLSAPDKQAQEHRRRVFALMRELQLSPRKLHPILEGADTKNGNRKNYSFWTFAARMSQTSPKKLFVTQFAAFFKILFTKINYYFD